MKKARIIYNPTAGRESFQKEMAFVLKELETAGYETSAHATTCEGDATQATRKAAQDGFDIIIAVGGDGTLNEVVNGLCEQHYRPKLGVIPAGTTNDFARALNIPLDIKGALNVITSGETLPIDVGKVNEHYFINIAGGGELTEVSYEVPSRLKTVLGQLAYFMKGIEMLPFIKPVQTKIEYDDHVYEGKIMLFLVGNTNSVGGFEKLAPDAVIDDGYFDLLILKESNIAEFIRVASLALRGAHLESDQLIHAKAKHVTVTPESNMQLNIDGEFGGMLPGQFRNLKQHLDFFVPAHYLRERDS